MDELISFDRSREIYVDPFYLELLHANFLRQAGDSARLFRSHLTLAAQTISDARLKLLLADTDWRPQLAASWFIGLTRREGFVSQLSKLLAMNYGSYADQGICFALGVIGGEESSLALTRYLKERLPARNGSGHESWALGALTLVVGVPPEEFMKTSMWPRVEAEESAAWAAIKEMESVITYLREHRVAQM